MTYTLFRRLFIAIAAMAAFVSTAVAQQASEPTPELINRIKSQPQNGFFGINFSFTRPQNDFRRTLDSIGKTGPILGFSLEGGYHFDPAPISAGLNIDFLFNGRDEKTFNYTTPPNRQFHDTLTASNTMIPINIFFRFQPNVARIFEPYVEAVAGMTILSGSSEFRTNFGSNSDNSKTSVAWNYGFGAGLNIRLVDFIELPNVNRSMFLNINARYIIGSEVNYAVAKYDETLQQISLSDIRSKTDMFYFRAGLMFRF